MKFFVNFEIGDITEGEAEEGLSRRSVRKIVDLPSTATEQDIREAFSDFMNVVRKAYF